MAGRSRLHGTVGFALLGLIVPASGLASAAAAHAVSDGPTGAGLTAHPAPHAGGPLVGSSLRDTATLSGGFHPTGTVTFTLYYNDSACRPAARVFSNSQPLSTGATSTSAPYTPTVAGAYQWVATYSGDANNNAVSGACGEAGERVVVRPSACHDTTRDHGFASPVDNGFADEGAFDNGDGNTGSVDNGDCNSGSLNNGDGNEDDGMNGDGPLR